MADRKIVWLSTGVLALGLCGAATARAQTAAPNESYDAQLARFLTAARKPAPAREWMTGLMTDRVARQVSDMVTVNVVENVTATGTADAGVNKSGGADVNLPISVPGLTKLVPSKAETKFSGSGSTNRSSQISAVITARVVEVL